MNVSTPTNIPKRMSMYTYVYLNVSYENELRTCRDYHRNE
jgi:hypothetical protein